MIKVLFILPYLHSGGTERVILTYMQGLDRSKYMPRLLLINHDVDTWDYALTDLDLGWVLESGQHLLRHPVRLLRRLKQEAQWADVIVGGMELTSTYLAVLAGRLARKPSLGWVHMDMGTFQPAHRLAHRVISRIAYPGLSAVIAVSGGVASSIYGLSPRAAARVRVIYNPVDVERIIRAGNQEAEQLDHPVVAAAGRLEHQKGFDLLLRAHQQLVHRGISHQLVIIGKGSQEETLKKLASSLGVQTSVTFTGFVDNPYPLMKQADVFVLSSRFEGFALVVVEALALGLAVVSTRCPSGPAEILGDQQYGLLVPEEDCQALAGAIERLLTDPHLRHGFQVQAAERAREYGVDTAVLRLQEIIDDVYQAGKSV